MVGSVSEGSTQRQLSDFDTQADQETGMSVEEREKDTKAVVGMSWTCVRGKDGGYQYKWVRRKLK